MDMRKIQLAQRLAAQKQMRVSVDKPRGDRSTCCINAPSCPGRQLARQFQLPIPHLEHPSMTNRQPICPRLSRITSPDTGITHVQLMSFHCSHEQKGDSEGVIYRGDRGERGDGNGCELLNKTN